MRKLSSRLDVIEGLPMVDRHLEEGPYLEKDTETMPRRDLEELQEAKLLELLPYVYERSALIRETWSEAGVHPRDIRSLDDFRERVPFIDKDALRTFRDRRCDPYGGLLCVDESELSAVMSTSGTTGDPTLVPEQWGARDDGRAPALGRDLWEMGARPGDHFTCMLFTFRGPFYAVLHFLGMVPLFLDHSADELPRLARLSLEYRPTGLYNLGTTLIHQLASAEADLGVDLVDVFTSYRGVVHAGEPLGSRARDHAKRWGIELFEQTGLADVGAATECREHDGCHFWEDGALVEHLDPDGSEPMRDGTRGELVATALDNRVAPLVRYRSDDLVRLTREPCACGRTHGRLWPIGRKGDEVLVEGRSVLPTDVWEALEQVDETSMGLFQIVRGSRREVDRLRLRVGHDGTAGSLDELADRVAEAVDAAAGVTPEIELVANDALLALGPPHKIPRVTRA